jgi:uncharacterized protein YqfA (UPF0365 family)
MKYVRLGTTVVVGILAASCVGAPPPHDKVASSEAAVRSAQELGGREVPQAGVYLELAQNELERGKALMRSGNNREAAAELDKARADAEVALALAKESKTRVAAQQAKARAQALRAGIPGSAIGGGPLQPAPPPSRTPAPTPVQPSGPMQMPTQPGPQPHPR